MVMMASLSFSRRARCAFTAARRSMLDTVSPVTYFRARSNSGDENLEDHLFDQSETATAAGLARGVGHGAAKKCAHMPPHMCLCAMHETDTM